MRYQFQAYGRDAQENLTSFEGGGGGCGDRRTNVKVTAVGVRRELRTRFPPDVDEEVTGLARAVYSVRFC